MQTIRRYGDLARAQLDESLLRSEGMLTYLKNENTFSVYPVYSNAVGFIELQVEPDEVERALEILGPEKQNLEEIGNLTRKTDRTLLIMLVSGLVVGGISWSRYSFDIEYFGGAAMIGMFGGLLAGLIMRFRPVK